MKMHITRSIIQPLSFMFPSHIGKSWNCT